MIFVGLHSRALKAIKLTFPLVNMWCKMCHWICESPLRITLQKRAHFAFSMQNPVHYFRWSAGLIVVTNSFLTGTKNDTVMLKILREFLESVQWRDFFQMADTSRLRGHSQKLKKERSRLDIRTFTFSQRGVIMWNDPPADSLSTNDECC